MKLATTSAIQGLFALAVMTSSPVALAQDAGWYGGANIGRSKANIDDERITSSLQEAGFTEISIIDDDKDRGFKLFGGYLFNKYYGVEGGYFDLGKFGYTAETFPVGTLDGEIRVRGVNLDIVGILPVTERFSAFARAGVNHAKVKGTFAGTGLVNLAEPATSERNTKYKLGLGLQFNFTESFGLRAEAERYRINDTVGNTGDIDLFSLGLVYRFGASAATPVASRPEPAAREEPALVIVPAPAAARTRQYCSILDIQFEINVDELQREDQEKLEVLGTFMNKYNDTTALIEGHTDNVGSSEQNMRLSQRRAESVTAYLVNNFNINPSRLKATGYGESRPIADNRTDLGRRQNRRINAVIACVTDIVGLTPAPARITMAMEMEFDTNQSNVRPQYREELRKVANFMRDNPDVVATVEGHTSNQQGGSSQNMQLSQRRAESVINYLVNQFGADRTRLYAAGFGQTRRVAYNTSVEGQQENRRVNIIFDFPTR